MKISFRNFFQKFVVINNIEGFLDVQTQQPSPHSRFLPVESSRYLRDQREEGSDRAPLTAEAVLRRRGRKRRSEKRKLQSFEDFHLRAEQADGPV